MAPNPPSPTDAERELALGRLALWMDPEDLVWLAKHCWCEDDAPTEVQQRCGRVRFRANAALHKASHRLE